VTATPPARRHTAAVSLLRGWEPPTSAQHVLRQEYVEHLSGHPDGLDRACRPDHLTASALVLTPDGSSVLLTLHAKAQQWFQLGGHVDPEDGSLAEAATREVLEESGLSSVAFDSEPVQLDIHKVPFCGGPGTRHLDVRFVAVADRATATAVSEESSEVAWWPAHDLPSDEASLEELVRLARRRLGVG